MSKDRLAELAEQLSGHNEAIEEIKAEMLEILTGKAAPARVVAAAAPKKPQVRKPATVRIASDDDDQNSDRTPPLHEVVLSLLEKGPATLPELVVGVKAMIKNGEYKSKAQKLTPVVSQALFKLKAEKLVNTEKQEVADETGKLRQRNVYSTASA